MSPAADLEFISGMPRTASVRVEPDGPLAEGGVYHSTPMTSGSMQVDA